MRKKRNPQCSLELAVVPHGIFEQLSAMSRWLDDHPQFLDWVMDDLDSGATKNTGRVGLSAESALRAALLKQYLQCDYDYLTFVLMDSQCFRQFCRLEANHCPRRSSLHALISRIKATTYEKINRGLLITACEKKIEKGRTVAIDSTVTATDIKAPYDSDLLAGGIKEICRLLEQGQQLTPKLIYQYTHHNKAVRDAARRCSYARKKEDQKPHYKKLLQLTRKSYSTLIKAVAEVSMALDKGQVLSPENTLKWLEEVEQLKPLVDAVVSQTQRRVFEGEKVPVQEKVVSLYEPHTDIIVKDRRQVQFGHKLNLVQGKSRLILDLVIETGNPADSERYIPMVERQKEIYGRVPRQVSVDGGYASKANLQAVKEMGVKDAAFHKKRGLEVEEMTKSAYVYKTLRRFRAGIEAGISWLKRCFGLSRCPNSGSERFDAHCWAAVVCYNLVILTRH